MKYTKFFDEIFDFILVTENFISDFLYEIIPNRSKCGIASKARQFSSNLKVFNLGHLAKSKYENLK